MRILQKNGIFPFILCGFALLTSIVWFALGLYLYNGTYIALSCMFAGLTVASFIWQRIRSHSFHDWMSRLLAANFLIMCGLACYINLSWALWAVNIPIDIGTIQNGIMGRQYWFGPFIIVIAVFSYCVFKDHVTEYN